MKCSSSTSGAKGQSRFCPECGSKMVEDVKIDTAVICNGKLDGKPCQSELIPGQKFCTSCGTKVDQSLFNIQEERCSKCSSLLFPGKPFCAECGQRKKIPSQPSDSINTEIESGNSSQNTIQSQKISDKESRSTKTDLKSSEMQKPVFGKVVGWGVNQKDTSVEVTSPHKSSLFLDKGKAGTQESVRPTKAKSKQSVAPETMENTNNNQSEDEEMKEKNDNDEGSSVNPGTFKEEAEQKYAKDKENKTMATLDNERYLRHILLLTEGGLLVLRGIVTREAARSGQTLEDMLRINKTILNKNLILKGHFVTLFPSASTVNANVQTWDMSLLIAVVKELFKGMSSADTSAISILEAFRTLMHSASMSAKDYDINRLETALRQLASGISKTEKKIEDIIMRTELENIDIQSSLRNDTENTIDTKVQGQEELGNIQGKSDVLQRHKQHLKNDLSRNWVRGGLGVKYFKVGLESLLDPLVVEQHKKILKKAQDESKFKQCQECKNKTFIPHEKSQCKRSEREKKKCPCANPNGRLCPSGRFCGIIYDQIASDHQCSEPNLKNTRIKNWSTCPWSIATTYINTEGYVDKSSAKEIDIGGLLGILKNNKNCNKYVVIEEIKRARKARNELFHHVNFELKKDELNKCIDAFKEVLKNKGISNDNVEEALQLLEKVQENQIDINISEDTEQREQNFRQHAMTEEVDIRQKMLNTEMEKSKQKSKEVELLCDIRKGRNTIGEKEEFRSSSDDRTCTKHQGMKNEWYCQEENIFCCKRCKEEEHKSCIEPFEGAIKAKRKTLEMDACPSNLPGPDLSNTGNSLHDV